jgi:deleted-in-malignant-brain-tumors protein 1
MFVQMRFLLFAVQIPYFSYGPVQFHNGDKYGLVCADGFDKKSAEVICKENNFFYGIPVCCSGFGPSSLDISLSNVQCTGNEASLKDCPHNKDTPVCASGHYAGVVCSHFDQPFTSK